MIQIIKSGAAIALTEKPNYIKLHTNGCYVLCDEREAQGIAYDSTPYNLLGRESMGELETVMLVPQDGGKPITETREIVDTLLGVTE